MLSQFEGQKYLNLETFRKNGMGVKTPVWFVRQGDELFVWTQMDSGKAKRIRRQGRVRITPCKANGELLGDWEDAQAEACDTPEALRHVETLMRKKYGLSFLGFRWLGRNARHTCLRVYLAGNHG